MQPEEGVIKFTFEHVDDSLNAHIEVCHRLMAWRNIMCETALVGRDPLRYDGAAYGNLSARVQPYAAERGERRFLVSGTQTGQLECVSPDDFCLVVSYDHRRNFVRSRGRALPSSESMTHGSVYDLDSHIRFVFHAHSPVIWRNAARLRIPTTPAHIRYGTPEMCGAVQRLYRETELADGRVFTMGGHEDGVVVFGVTAEEVGGRLLHQLARGYESAARDSGRLCRYAR